MARPKKTYKKSKKRYYNKRYYKRRYSKKYRFRKFKKAVTPEIQQFRGTLDYTSGLDGSVSNSRGSIYTLLNIATQSSSTQPEDVKFSINGKPITGSKIKLKWLYIKGYYRAESPISLGAAADVNLHIKIFRVFKNLTNTPLSWRDVVQDNIDYNNIDSDAVQRQLLYLSDMKNDLKGKLWIKTKKIYRKYTPINSYIPFKIRIPLYDAVVQCDSYLNGSSFIANSVPSTNGLYLSVLSPTQFPDGPLTESPNRAYKQLFMKYKIYYTDN